MTTSRRAFIRQGALWVVGAALVEPVHRKLWAFPHNPTVQPLSDEEYLTRLLTATNRAWEAAQVDLKAAISMADILRLEQRIIEAGRRT